VNMYDLSETYPIALALDPQLPSRLYIACGIYQKETGVLCISDDYGKTFSYKTIPVNIHGNLNGRGTGNRLIVDSLNHNVLYFASQENGLLKSFDFGNTWTSLNVCNEKYMTFVWSSPDGNTLIVGTAGVSCKKNDNMRGTSLFVSYDSGMHFEKMLQPDSILIPESRLAGYVAQRYDFDGTYLYITLSNTGARSYVVENGYSCDSGDALGGRIIRYSFTQDYKIEGYLDITPGCSTLTSNSDYLSYGFSGISSCKQVPGMLVATTICKDDGDIIYLSENYGDSWQPVLEDFTVGKIHFNTPYMKPEYNGGHSILHWLSDIKINPNNASEVWFNSGTGVFACHNMTNHEERYFQDNSNGIEETVHLNVYSPLDGDVLLIDILGDLGGFAFKELDKPCENSFADQDGNRYITCINADFSDNDCQVVIVTPRGNWTGKTKGGLILSKNQCKTFERLSSPFGISDDIDLALKNIENPNVNSGWVALGADTNHIVWSIADQIFLPKKLVICSHDQGITFQQSKIYNLKHELTEDGSMKVFSDRVNASVFYGMGDHSDFYISCDGGSVFHQIPTPDYFPMIDFSLIDCANKTEVRGDSGKQGVFYAALGEAGLWKFIFNCEEKTIKTVKLTSDSDIVYRLGLGVIRQGGDYKKEDKAFYISGVIKNKYGFYRSVDEG
ncbi:MAG: endoglucanase, partial [Clostridiales bacterium]|nr:endoglucanase [Clostridiales bacterium]